MKAPTLRSAVPSGSRWDCELAGISLRFGAGRLEELGSAAHELGARHVLLIVDRGLRSAGHIDRALDSLDRADLETTTFDGVLPNPTSDLVREAANRVAETGIDLIVGIGGGSAMDCAKGINFLLTNGGKMEDYWGYDKASRALLPSIGVPTTAGTGSDAQSYTLITESGSGRKMACGAPQAAFRTVLLDPLLTISTPRETIAAAGIDAIAHAVESQVTRTRTEASSALAQEAWGLLDSSFRTCVDSHDDELEARGKMLLGAHLAGAAIEASMLGAAHACANPLTARYGVTHGVAVGILLPQVIRFNAEIAAAHYEALLPEGPEALALRIERSRAHAGLPARLRECRVPRNSLPELAELATHEWTGGHNPRPLDQADFLALYESVY